MKYFIPRLCSLALLCVASITWAAETNLPAPMQDQKVEKQVDLKIPKPDSHIKKVDPKTVKLESRVQKVEPKNDPKEVKPDSRIRIVDYKRDEVVTIYGYFGFVTLVELEADEEIDADASSIGFVGPWEVKPLRNKFTIKPRWEEKTKGVDGKEAAVPFPANVDSNLLIVTDKRSYLFTLKCVSRCVASSVEAKGMTYLLRFRFPDPKFAGSDDLAENKRNYRYSAQSMPGTEGDDPASVWDDSTFTYLRFYKLQEIPAVFVVNPDGTESVVDTSVQQGDTIVVPRVVKTLILRKGEKYATLIIKEDMPERTFGANNGTVVPGAVKEVRKPK